MISAVWMRLLYLIFQQVLGLILLMSRAASTKDVELLVLPTRSPYSAAPTPDPCGVPERGTRC